MRIGEQSASLFEERAEYLTRQELESWTALSARERGVVSKLKATGAKLLIGPRGSGKSTLMLIAYYQLLDNDEALPAYVNYARHLAVEPIFKSRPDATELFRQWVLAKVLLGFMDTNARLLWRDREWDNLARSAKEFVDALEMGTVPADYEPLSPTRIIDLINHRVLASGRRRCVLLFDDAAHAFSQPQQREFFEIFRQLRTRGIAPKAAVYPGVTNYSANMHIGHDAEVLEAWYRADDPAFIESMQDVLQRRLPSEMRAGFEGDRSDLLEYLALASFGLPRRFLTMIQEVLEYDDDEGTYKSPNRRNSDRAIERNVSNVRSVFESTGDKIPRYANLIAEGRRLEDAFLASLSRANLSKPVGRKILAVGVKRPLSKEFQHVLDLMSYAGIIRKIDSQSRGSAGVFDRYEMHSGFVISSNALSLGRSPSARDIVSSLTRRPAAGLVRGRPESWLGEDYRSRCTLNLSPCSHCGSPRASEEAQFCMNCGKPLSNRSVYSEILQRPLTDLPIPEKKKKALARTNLISVQDVLLDVEFKELLRGHYIGSVWAKKIFSSAEEYVSV